MKKKVLLAANSCWYLHNFRGNFISQLIRLGYELTAVAPKDEYCSHLESCNYINLKMHGGSVNPFREMSAVRQIRKILAEVQPDIVLSYGSKTNMYFGTACKTVGIPQIANVSGIGVLKSGNPLMRRAVLYLYRRALQGCAHVFFQNQEDMESFLTLGIADPKKSQRIMGSGVDVKRFALQQMPELSGQIRIAYVGRLIESKGLPHIIHALNLIRSQREDNNGPIAWVPEDTTLPDIHLDVFGSAQSGRAGSLDTTKLSEFPGLQLHGHRSDMAQALEDVHIVCLPSYYGEGVPRSLLEALALGKIIITSDHPGCRDTLVFNQAEENVTQGGARIASNGALVPPKDSQAIAEAIVELWNRRSRWADMGKASRNLAEQRFDEKDVNRRYTEVMQRILNQSSTSGAPAQ